MSRTVCLLNDPNLNLLGSFEPHLYGSERLAEREAGCGTLTAQLIGNPI